MSKKLPLKQPNWARLKRVYGITEAKYKGILKEQGGTCYICLRDPREFVTKKYRHNHCVDHCHTSLEIRGLLCKNCNTYISRWLHDDPEKAKRAMTYLGRDTNYGKVPTKDGK